MVHTLLFSHYVDREGNLSAQSRSRTLRAATYAKETGSRIISSGGNAGTTYPHALAMAEVAYENGVRAEDLLLEPHSLDSLGQMLLSKAGILDYISDREVRVVSTEYHIPRLAVQADLLLPRSKGFRVTFDAVRLPVGDGRLEEYLREEAPKPTVFLKTFKGVNPGDTASALHVMFRDHDLYKGNQALEQTIKNWISRNKERQMSYERGMAPRDLTADHIYRKF